MVRKYTKACITSHEAANEQILRCFNNSYKKYQIPHELNLIIKCKKVQVNGYIVGIKCLLHVINYNFETYAQVLSFM